MKHFKKEFSYLIISIGVVLIWRGIWGFADLYLLPDNYVLSHAVSIILGIIVLKIFHESFHDLF